MGEDLDTVIGSFYAAVSAFNLGNGVVGVANYIMERHSIKDAV